MCKRNLLKHTACKHTTLNFANPLTQCERSLQCRFKMPCAIPVTYVQVWEGYCRTCTAELIRSLESLRKMQEQGWEWSSKWDEENGGWGYER
jgi:hypothetical protein